MLEEIFELLDTFVLEETVELLAFVLVTIVVVALALLELLELKIPHLPKAVKHSSLLQ